MSANEDNVIQSIDSIEMYTYGTNKEIIHTKKEIKWINIIQQLTMTMLQNKI